MEYDKSSSNIENFDLDNLIYNPLLGTNFNTNCTPDITPGSDPVYNTYISTGHPVNFKYYCLLLDLCQKLGTSLKGFNLVLEWAQEAFKKDFKFIKNHPS